MSEWTGPNYAAGWTVPGYLEERQVGQGASGRVVAAVSEVTGQRVAIKYLSPSLVRDPSFMWGFRSEAQTLRALDVPQVVHLYDYVEAPGQGAAIVMELVDGVSLHEMISERGPTTAESALVALKGSLLGLSAAHTLGIVHRDYKPENVLVDSEGNSKLSDFGVAIKAGKSGLAGTPLYMAPEQWKGAPSSPATDVYAATAVFYECLTAKPPFSGSLGKLRTQHETAPVPLDGVDESLHGLIVHGMAKNPADRPQSAIAFVAELESAADEAYGADWEERGRSHLAERVAALLPLLLLRGGTPGSSGTSTANTWLRGGNRHGGGNRLARGRLLRGSNARVLPVVTLAAAIVVAVSAVATAVEMRSHNDNLKSSSNVSAITPTFTAQAAVTPPVQSTPCKTPVTFAYTGIITATAPGTASYRWVYSSGKQGPVQHVSFAATGDTQVTGDTVSTKTGGTGWGEIQMINPAGKASNEASYKLLCTSGAGGFSAAASVQPSVLNVGTCGTAPPAFTATGSITSPKAAKVTYYWALSNGHNTAPATITFTKAGTTAVTPLTITPGVAPTNGQAVLVVTGPFSTASKAAPYSVTCNAAVVTAAAKVSPATQVVSPCTAAVPAFTFSGTLTSNQAGTVSYHWSLPSGNGPTQTLTFAAAGTEAVAAATYKPASDTASGSGSIVVTYPSVATSGAAAFKLTCSTPLTVTTSGAATAATGTAYSATATVTGGKGTYKWAAATGLPPGLTAVASAGKLTISGTPTTAGAYTIKLSVSDGSTPALTGTASLSVTVSGTPLTLTGGTLAAGTVNAAYSATVTATGGTGTKTYTATGLPAGLTMSTAGTISGTPTAAGTSTVTVTVTDTASPAQTATGTFTLTVSAPALTLGGGTLASGQVRVAYSATVTASGGTGTKTYSASGLPPGLSMGTGGTISGVPTTAGSYSVTVTVTDTASPAQTATGSYTIDIAAAVVPSTPPPSSSPVIG